MKVPIVDRLNLSQVEPGHVSRFWLELTTAAFGLVNIYYVRADMTKPTQQTMARLFNPDVILHDPAPLGTLRRAAMDIDIEALTITAGGPHRFQQDAILPSRMGLFNLLVELEMQEGAIEVAADPPMGRLSPPFPAG